MMPSIRWYTASTHQKHPAPRVTVPGSAGFVRGSLDSLTTSFGVLPVGLVFWSVASLHAVQQSKAVQLNSFRKVFICFQVDAAKRIVLLGRAEDKMLWRDGAVKIAPFRRGRLVNELYRLSRALDQLEHLPLPQIGRDFDTIQLALLPCDE